MELFAGAPVDEVTVQDIAAAVDMTPAAVYYHFASKEQILVEGLRQFADRLLAEVRAYVPTSADGGRDTDGAGEGIAALLTHVVTWAGQVRPEATVYFVNSLGLNLMVESMRREVRVELIEILRPAVLAVRPALSGAEAGVMAVALVSLIETALASMLNGDSVHSGFGTTRFVAEVAAVADRITGAG